MKKRTTIPSITFVEIIRVRDRDERSSNYVHIW